MVKTPKISILEQEDLCKAVEIEVKMYQRGEIFNLTTNSELGKLYGVSKQTISNWLKPLRETNPNLCKYRYVEIIKLVKGWKPFEVIKEEILMFDQESTNLRKDPPKIDMCEVITSSLIKRPSLCDYDDPSNRLRHYFVD